MLRLVEGKVVSRARHGSKALTQGEIESAYGSPPVFSALNYPSVCRKMNDVKDSYCLYITYFDCQKVPLICKGIELIDSGLIKKSYFEFAQDI